MGNKVIFSPYENLMMRIRQIIKDMEDLHNDLLFVKGEDGNTVTDSIVTAKRNMKNCLATVKSISDFGVKPDVRST